MHDDLFFYSNPLSIHILGSIIKLLGKSLLNFQLGLRLLISSIPAGEGDIPR